MISQRKAGELLAADGPRYYFETSSPEGAGTLLEHTLWQRRGVRFDVHLDVRGKTPAASAAALIASVEAFKSNFAAAQPGVRFPGYGVRLAALGGWYSYQDFGGFVPIASCHPEDALPQFVNGFQYSPVPFNEGDVYQTGAVTTIGFTPTSTAFKIGSGSVHGRPAGGLVNNTVEFTTGALSGQSRRVIEWEGNIVTVESAFSSAPSGGDACRFRTTVPAACYRFENGRADLAAWTEAFFDEIDSLWPAGLERPEVVACTTENLTDASIAWAEEGPLDSRPLKSYLDYDVTHPDLLTDTLSLTEWIAQYAKDLNGDAIDIEPPLISPRSPARQDVRSVALGAMYIGVAWTWQLSFVNRMKQSWPRTRFMQYLLGTGNRRSPLRTQPGEVFYHGEPWPPDVHVSHDKYYRILEPLFTAAISVTGIVDFGETDTTFVVASGTPFVSSGFSWGTAGFDHLRFAVGTSTPGLSNAPAIIESWDAGTRRLVCTTYLPAQPESSDLFYGYVELDPYTDWTTYDIGWAVWAAYDEFFGHTGTLDERYRATCVSWSVEASRSMCRAWPRHEVVPYWARRPEADGGQLLEDFRMYPDGPLVTVPGMQTRDDWVQMLAQSMDAGVVRNMVFEPKADLVSVLDAWDDIFAGVRAFYDRNLVRYQTLAPHYRNREWRKRRLWRH